MVPSDGKDQIPSLPVFAGPEKSRDQLAMVVVHLALSLEMFRDQLTKAARPDQMLW
jgi:hypothetical protein